MDRLRSGRRKGWRKREGVALLRRSVPGGGFRWLARYRDPDSRKIRHETVPPDMKSDEERAAWAAMRSKELKSRGDQIARGAPRKKNLTLRDAVESYFDSPPTVLKPKTIEAYRGATDSMLSWASEAGIEVADDLRGENIAGLRAWLVNRPMHVQKSRPDDSPRKRSVASINSDFRRLKTVLQELRRKGLVPFLSLEVIVDNFKALVEPKRKAAPLESADLKRIVGAAVRHDDERYVLTRDEKARGSLGGEVSRFKPILPFLVTVLLSGMRKSEAAKLKWESVDLAAPRLRLGAEEVEKTGQERDVDLNVSPLLAELLGKMWAQAGDTERVFDLSDGEIEAARKRLIRVYGAPRFAWSLRKQPLGSVKRATLRATCGTFLANAPGIFGAASAYREARQLGHSVAVAEKHYLGVVRVDPAAQTLEAAMGLEAVLRKALDLHLRSATIDADHG